MSTSQDGGSEHVMNAKLLYSDTNTFYGSDETSEYYKTFKNRSII